MKNAIVTGSNGFIGRHLVERLNKEGFQVYRVTHDFLDSYSKLRELILKIQPEYIYHLASYGNMGNQQDDDETMRANIVRTWTLLKATQDIPYKLFVNFSTSSVYGFYTKAMNECCKPHPQTMYAATKMATEYICRAHRKKYKKLIVTVRPFSVYGPGEAEFRFIPTVIHKAFFKETAQVLLGYHDWIYISDFIDAVMTITNSYQYLTKRTFNIGSEKMYSNEEVVQEISKHIEVNYDIIPKFKHSDSKIWVSDSARMKSLNWEPRVSLEEGIEKTVEYYKNIYAGRSVK